ncbi:MAG: bifunctional phosphopantothenoylcysteine decarboxylase/phosphopantothenate--cysteine ligase CoaBC [Actinomycetales bacterium]|jgi:phosphopantothenoylcysteine decarboxylase/phosphopantothenate--cysteine ligase|uniref:Coenzyme A biosynthesis bifunctional protein CoaBC n=1 Tax=Candidatus Phosphoribacter hodrii TaxID=2953743 RepID=A0A935CEY3_9MICO|nr:bifunctional phosphopantothenoylcysteine decarboxylase/phosphopantothenate--cysteine ligase CoaBC [Candidatus Phosphoribacter hodrii]MBP8837656.1 bifunctional phosphopantothenoylcysteine decarboxylase/phosphopantothenate--cysteine ligase CoaBC [Dermatophilaceae bacterium]OPZ56458.1 MAG: Coenzyme A biosynthesis bifunctional protein CoaBC [bacterium ADurb.BinA028]MBK7272854.1 bifunctional phosphopantothenoylcysteine decarboxylase/phosphopantothenate--cysteine ligase CoaBC [Candidatus Phosphorib
MRVVLGVSGGIAAYKAASLLRRFTESGHDVTVVPTEAALQFVGAPTWAALSGHPVATDVWTAVDRVPHVRIGQDADLVVVAPATADLLAKAATGQAGDLLTATLLTARCPVVFAPAMHTEMWLHPATQANVATLRSRGAHVIEPSSGRLTGADTGPGRLPEPEDLYAACLAVVAAADPAVRAEAAGDDPHGDVRGDLRGVRVLVTAGGTREALDPVRYLGNRSSGKQGVALAQVAAARGAEVTLVACNLSAAVGGSGSGGAIRVVPVESALDLQAAVTTACADVDVVVMCAAVADFRPKHYVETKIKKTHAADGSDDSAPVIELVRNPDILAGLVVGRGAAARPIIVGFAAETGDETGSVVELARVKLARKGCDLLVANEVGATKTFGEDTNTVHLLFADGRPVVTVGPATKSDVAAAVWDGIQVLLPAAH